MENNDYISRTYCQRNTDASFVPDTLSPTINKNYNQTQILSAQMWWHASMSEVLWHTFPIIRKQSRRQHQYIDAYMLKYAIYLYYTCRPSSHPTPQFRAQTPHLTIWCRLDWRESDRISISVDGMFGKNGNILLHAHTSDRRVRELKIDKHGHRFIWKCLSLSQTIHLPRYIDDYTP